MKKTVVIILLLLCVTTFAHAEILRQGSTGQEVVDIQQRLIELGYLTGRADGIYGKNTAAAVASFQEDNGLIVNGIANNETQSAILNSQVPSTTAFDYVLNTNSKKFHYPDCSGVAAMKEKNKQYFHGTREEAIEQGYSPCGTCNP